MMEVLRLPSLPVYDPSDIADPKARAIMAALECYVDAFRKDAEEQQRESIAIVLELEKQNENLDSAKRRLEEVNVRLEQANRAKDNFLANASHDMRTPMNGVIGMLELLLRSQLSDEQRRWARMAKECAGGLLHLLNDILDLSRIEAGRLDLLQDDFDLRELVDRCAWTLGAAAEGKGVRLTCHIRPEVPAVLIGDAHRLGQVVTNLFGNAVKFTERGEVEVSVDLASAEGSEATLHVAVRDTGVGIPADEQDRIFEVFGRAPATQGKEGTGLGLAISSHLVSLMGGRIWVESEPGRGSTFHFTARFGVRAGAKPDAHRAAPRVETIRDPLSPNSVASPGDRTPDGMNGGTPRHLRILLAEDGRVNREYAVTLLEQEGHAVRVASNGREALNILETEPFDLVLMDVQMPEMDGLEATEAIREQEGSTGQHVPIVAMTAQAMKGDRERCLEAGMDDYISKPVDPDNLSSVIERVVQAPPSACSVVGTRAEALEPSTEGDPESQALRAARPGNSQALRRILEIFVPESEELLQRIRDAVSQGDSTLLSRSAHTLRGAVRVLQGTIRAAPTVEETALRLEQMGEEGDLGMTEEVLSELESAMKDLRPQIASIMKRE